MQKSNALETCEANWKKANTEHFFINVCTRSETILQAATMVSVSLYAIPKCWRKKMPRLGMRYHLRWIGWKCLAGNFQFNSMRYHLQKYVRAAVCVKYHHFQFSRKGSLFTLPFLAHSKSKIIIETMERKMHLPWISSTQIFKSSRNASKCGRHWHLQSSIFCWFLPLIPSK